MRALLASPAFGLAALVATGFGLATAADQAAIVTPDRLEWAGTPALPPGAQVAVISGDPAGQGPFVLRARLPGGYEVPAHHHPTTEYVTVLEGSFGIGHGDVLDRAHGQLLPPGGFATAPAGQHHFAWTGPSGAVIQVHGQGPFAITYVDPAKDPRRQQAPAR